ncbi:MAG TPA: hypothetical protein VKQ73_02705 [Stellaceae bacterium]|nr:hypothetical protein [Stellaceae bacterium]
MMADPQKLRELAAWHREFAEWAPNRTIEQARLRMAEELERAARRLERPRARVLEPT